LEAVERKLTRCVPKTAEGAIVALRYFTDPRSLLMDGLEARHARFLTAMVARLADSTLPASQ
jgi:hypothetical protein